VRAPQKVCDIVTEIVMNIIGWTTFATNAKRLGLACVGTGNAQPWHQKFRGAQNVDNLYTCSILARRRRA